MKRVNLHEQGSLRKKLLILIMCIMLICIAIIGVCFMRVSKDILQQKQIENARSDLSHAAFTVEDELEALEELMGYFFVDQNIRTILSADAVSEYEQILQWNQFQQALLTYERQECFQYINCIIFYNYDGNVQSFSYMTQEKELFLERNEELGWYQKALESNGQLQWGSDMVSEPDAYLFYTSKIGEADLSLLRGLKDVTYQSLRGCVYVSVCPEYLSVLRENNNLMGMTQVYLFDSAGQALNAYSFSDTEYTWLSLLEQTGWQDEDFRYCVTGQNIIYEYAIPSYGYRLVAVSQIEEAALLDSNLVLLGSVSLMLIFAVTIILWIFLNQQVMQPIDMLSDTMEQVHKAGVMEHAPRMRNAEFEYLSENFNKMVDKIQELMEEKLNKEREIQMAEHQALLAQLNPHFVYNALAAIQMMAYIQGADNIKDTVDALWRMLKNSTSKAKEEFTLGDELQNVKDYIYILQVTNVPKFQVIYEIEEGLEAILCPRFLIQPIVENAIVHGILPKQGFSDIRINAVSEGDFVVVTVSNDGLIIPENRLQEVRANLSDGKNVHKGIGLGSIKQRMQLLYPDKADLTIASNQKDGITEVKLHFPKNERTEYV